MGFRFEGDCLNEQALFSAAIILHLPPPEAHHFQFASTLPHVEPGDGLVVSGCHSTLVIAGNEHLTCNLRHITTYYEFDSIVSVPGIWDDETGIYGTESLHCSPGRRANDGGDILDDLCTGVQGLRLLTCWHLRNGILSGSSSCPHAREGNNSANSFWTIFFFFPTALSQAT